MNSFPYPVQRERATASRWSSALLVGVLVAAAVLVLNPWHLHDALDAPIARGLGALHDLGLPEKLNLHAAEFAANIAALRPARAAGRPARSPAGGGGSCSWRSSRSPSASRPCRPRALLPAAARPGRARQLARRRRSASACRWRSGGSPRAIAEPVMTRTRLLFALYLVGARPRDPLAPARRRRRVRPGPHDPDVARLPRDRPDVQRHRVPREHRPVRPVRHPRQPAPPPPARVAGRRPRRWRRPATIELAQLRSCRTGCPTCATSSPTRWAPPSGVGVLLVTRRRSRTPEPEGVGAG